ncbi:uncharacterized protein E5676_scaffold871G00070 [Cucumis melo var. makuwa]|uniref:Uncharacterized protein n=1 Tax=Cucumis melo var. makuwa TaxID=1194695 RepID=A0A5D3CE66_CUCMM|nr:uncharacterized protein E6C27_scaffold21G002410 [Cucumis melo var. makuwa]TYK08646.1 uncharacterized protein E5676_scaffold871G00070 [Cucumis melo var. makuwa]
MIPKTDIDQSLDNTTLDGIHTKETTVSISTTVDAHINAAMDEWFRSLQITSTNMILSPFSSFVPSLGTYRRVYLVQITSTNHSLPLYCLHLRPIMSSTRRFHVLPPNFVQLLLLLQSNVYALPPTHSAANS